MKIDFFTCLYMNSANYADNLYDNLQKVTSKTSDISFFALFKQGNVDVLTKKWKNIPVDFKYVGENLSGGETHSQLLNKIYPYLTNNSDYTVICDCDVMVVMKYWDILIDNIFKDNKNVVAVSTPKPCKVFSVFFTVFKTDFLKNAKVDFRNGRGKLFKSAWHFIKNDYEAMVYKLNINDKIVIDTGNRIPFDIIRCGKDYILAEIKDNTKYFINNKYYVSHLGGSRHKDFNDKETQRWIKECNEYIKINQC